MTSTFVQQSKTLNMHKIILQSTTTALFIVQASAWKEAIDSVIIYIVPSATDVATEMWKAFLTTVMCMFLTLVVIRVSRCSMRLTPPVAIRVS